MADTMPPNTITPLGPGFFLDTSHPATAPLGLIDPCWFIGITGSTLPAVQSLDLADVVHPVLNSNLNAPPDPNAPQDFKLFLGMLAPPSSTPQFIFDLPSGMPRDNGDGTYDFDWTATTLALVGGPSFIGQFHLDLGDGSVSRWSVLMPSDSNPGRSSFEIDFTVTPNTHAVGDPALTFSLGENLAGQTTPLSFTPGAAPVPEPGSLALLGSGLAALAGLRKRHSQFRKKCVKSQNRPLLS